MIKELEIDMSILKNTSEVQRAHMESGMVFNHDDDNSMMSTTTELYGAKLANKTVCGLEVATHHQDGRQETEDNQSSLNDDNSNPPGNNPQN